MESVNSYLVVFALFLPCFALVVFFSCYLSVLDCESAFINDLAHSEGSSVGFQIFARFADKQMSKTRNDLISPS